MNVYKKSILLILFFLITISCKISKNTEKEPSNTFSNANIIEINKENTGYLESDNDVDNFALNVSEDQVIKIELSGVKGVNHAVSIYKIDNAKSQLIKVIDDNRKSASETFANLYVQPGQYILSVIHGSRDIKKGNSDTPYTLLITSKTFLEEEKEPNDTPYTATEIADKTIIKGFFSPAQNNLNNDEKYKMREIDWYKFSISISDDSPVLIDLKLTGVEGVDSVITLLNSSLEEILTVDASGTGEGEIISDLGIKESGAYYVQVSSKNFLFNHDTQYELHLYYKTYDQNSELEANNSFEKANTIQNNMINGKIISSDDYDFFQYTPPFKNKFYKIGCTGTEGLNIIMTIYDNNRNKLFDINNAGPGEPERIPYFMIKNPIYISISASSLSLQESRYNIDIERFESNELIEVEPNNTKSSANILDKNITGYITYKNDTDYYLIQSDAKKKFKVLVKGVKDGKIRVSTTDPLGFIIKSKEIESDSEISFIEIFDKKGYLIIETITANYEYPYTISLEEL